MSLARANCLKCGAAIVKGDKLEVKDGKKFYPSYEPDGTTIHVCKSKDQKGGKQYVPPKPRETFLFDEFIDIDSKGKQVSVRRVYAMQTQGFVGELDPIKTFADMEMKVWKYRAAQSGNPVSKTEEGLASSEEMKKK